MSRTHRATSRVAAAVSQLALCLLICSLGCSGPSANTDKKSTGPDPVKKDLKLDPKEDGAKNEDKVAALTYAGCKQNACVLHAGSGRYHTCLHMADGRCAHYGATCEPSDRCFFDSKSNSFRTCSNAGEGECFTLGAKCRPSQVCMFDASKEQYRTCSDFNAGVCKRFAESCDPKAAAARP